MTILKKQKTIIIQINQIHEIKIITTTTTTIIIITVIIIIIIIIIQYIYYLNNRLLSIFHKTLKNYVQYFIKYKLVVKEFKR